MRLQKYLAMCGVASRRKSEEIITSGRVLVNKNKVTELGSKIDPDTDEVRVDGRVVKLETKRLILFNKPKGVITTLKDTHGRKTVSDFLADYSERFFPVGRLDADTTGLLLLTTDGDLAQKLAHPSFEIEKVYETKVKGNCTQKEITILENGLKLEDGVVKAKVKILKKNHSTSFLKVVIHVGKKRIVRRMFAELNLPVLELKRIAHGPFKLSKLKPGELKEVDYSKIAIFQNKI